MPPNFSFRPTYTSAQLTQYFDHIRLPQRYRNFNASLAQSPEGLHHLARLKRYQLATVPWENLSKHYSRYSTPVTALLHPNDLFDKIVGSASGRSAGGGGRGGGCLENNTFFGTVLRSLGYDCYPGGGRVNMGGGNYTAWEHMVNFVTIAGRKYVVDVGFGAKGPVAPVLVSEDTPAPNIEPAAVRLVRAPIPAHTDPAQRLWIYQLRVAPGADWEDVYCFSETEFLPQDFAAMTVGTTFKRNSFFAYSIAMCRMLMAGEVGVGDVEADEIVGMVTLTERECRRRVRGRGEVLGVFREEGDRLEALRRWFGIEFGESERGGVVGTVVGLGADRGGEPVVD